MEDLKSEITNHLGNVGSYVRGYMEEIQKYTADDNSDGGKELLFEYLNRIDNELKIIEQKDPNEQFYNKNNLLIFKSFYYLQKGKLSFSYLSSDDEIRESVGYFRESLKYLESIDAYYNLARGLEALGEYEESRDMYQKCIDKGDPKIAVMARQAIQRLESTASKKGKSGCFIATAVYGEPNAPEVRVFRNFRDEVLLSYSIGRKFVSLYYQFSPYIASLISKSNLTKLIIQTIILKPALWTINFRKEK